MYVYLYLVHAMLCILLTYRFHLKSLIPCTLDSVFHVALPSIPMSPHVPNHGLLPKILSYYWDWLPILYPWGYGVLAITDRPLEIPLIFWHPPQVCIIRLRLAWSKENFRVAWKTPPWLENPKSHLENNNPPKYESLKSPMSGLLGFLPWIR